jgi:uncharacterized protein YegP (UPF0339 family)
MRTFIVSAVLFIALFPGVMTPPATAQKPAATGPVIEINESAKDGRFRFVIRGADGKALAMSVGAGYATDKDCMKALDTLKSVIGKAKIVKNAAKKDKPKTEK